MATRQHRAAPAKHLRALVRVRRRALPMQAAHQICWHEPCCKCPPFFNLQMPPFFTPIELYRRFGPCEPADLQDRMKSAVALLGEQEVRSIVREQGKIEVRCEFCAETYSFDESEVLAVMAANGGA